MLAVALKEWAVICRALAQGRQAILLRKGGIAEEGNDFRLEHPRFWLYPTFTHQQQSGIKPEAEPLLKEVEADQSPASTVRLSHFAEACGAYHVHDLIPTLMLNHLHLWSEETVRSRFAYRRPGLFVVPVRVYKAAAPVEITESPEFAGCRSWVDLRESLATEGASPVLPEEEFEELVRRLELLLNPTAFA